MEHKRVTFKIAKAIKEVGYPQGNTDKCYLTADHNQFYKKAQIVDNEDGEWAVLTKNLADIPTYLDVWLWLWREKKMVIDLMYSKCGMWQCVTDYNCQYHEDPEEAIIEAIEYLVDNNLIK